MPQIKKIGMLSLAFLASQLILSKFLYPIIGQDTKTMFSIGTGIGGNQVGSSIISYVSGFTNFGWNIPVIALMFLGTFILTYLGFLIYEQRKIKLPQGRDLTGRIFWILVYGHAALFGLLYLLKMNTPGIAVSLLIGVGINLLLVSALVTLSARKLNFPKI